VTEKVYPPALPLPQHTPLPQHAYPPAAPVVVPIIYNDRTQDALIKMLNKTINILESEQAENSRQDQDKGDLTSSVSRLEKRVSDIENSNAQRPSHCEDSDMVKSSS
jgi:hypothetical protein